MRGLHRVALVALVGCGGTQSPLSGEGGESGSTTYAGVPESTGGSSDGSSGESSSSGGIPMCEPVDWGYQFYYRIESERVSGHFVAPCVVFATTSEPLGTMAHDTGLGCEFDVGVRFAVSTRVVVLDDTAHPLRPGDRVDIEAIVPSGFGFGEFVLRDPVSGENLLGADGLKSDGEMLGGLHSVTTIPDCEGHPLPDVLADECWSGAVAFQADLSFGGESVTMEDGSFASVGDMEVFVNAVEYQEAPWITCFDVVSGRYSVIFGQGFTGPEHDGCDLLGQDCPSGQRCVPTRSGPDAWDETRCVAAGSLRELDPCAPPDWATGEDGCGVGLVCVADADSAQGGRCRPQCAGELSDPQCDDGERCNLDAAGPVPPLVCMPRCAPGGLECDEPTQACVYMGEVFVCANVGDAGPTEACISNVDCAPGLTCTSGEFVDGCAGQACCAAFCSLADPSCAQGTCEPFLADPPPGAEDVGVCVILR